MLAAETLALVLILVLGAVLLVLLRLRRAMDEHTAAINFTNEQIGQYGVQVKRFTEALLQVNLENETRTALHESLMVVTRRLLKLNGGS